MLVNFRNMICNDVDDIDSGHEPRKTTHMCIDVCAIYLRNTAINKKDAWLVVGASERASDSKTLFWEKEKAEAYYQHLVDNLVNGTPFLSVDALEHGAI